jgi:hypothetical protein
MSNSKFFENLAYKNFDNREKSFINLSDLYKKAYKGYRDDLSSFSVMGEEEKEERHLKVLDLCEHFAVTTKNKEDIVITEFWPQYLNGFMTPKLFDIVPNSWFTKEIGFCFACKHFKGQKKGAHWFFHSLNRKVVGIFGKCNKYKNTNQVHKDYKFIFKYNNHVMTHFRCRGWQPSKFYEQLIKHRLLLILTHPKAKYDLGDFYKEQNKINVFGFLGATMDMFNEYYEIE